MVGGIIPALLALGSIRWLNKQAIGSKPVGSSFYGLSQLLTPGSCPIFDFLQ